MVHEVTFNSDNYPNGQMIGLACGYISLTKIEFINENVTVDVEAKTGVVDFYDSQGAKRLSVEIKTPLSGDEKFSEVKCIAEGGKIKLGFPSYTYKDNYPNCDGEHDRWDSKITGFRTLKLDLVSGTIL